MPFNTPKEGHAAVGKERSLDSSRADQPAIDASRCNSSSKIDLLAKQLGQLAKQLDALADEESQSIAEPFVTSLTKGARPELIVNIPQGHNARAVPLDAGRIRMIIRQRQMRASFFKRGLFSDPAWDMLLDLTAAQIEGIRVSVTSLCIASGVPDTTALRWINVMIDEGLFKRVNDKNDKRRVFIELTSKAVTAVDGYFHALGGERDTAA